MKKYKFILPIISAIIIIGIIFSNYNFQEIFSIIKTAKIGLLFLSFLFFPSTLLILALRWKIILNANSVNISYRQILPFYLGSIPLSKISPSNSGDISRALFLKNTLPLSKNLGIVILENLFDIFALLLLCIMGALIKGSLIIALTAFLIILCILCLLKYGVRIKINNEKWKQRMDNIFYAKSIINKPILALKIFLLSLLPWLIIILCVKLFFLSYGANVPLLAILINQPISIFLGLLPITFSGIGVRESSMIYLYSSYASHQEIIAAGLTYSFTAAVFLPLLCLPFLIITLKSKSSYAK